MQQLPLELVGDPVTKICAYCKEEKDLLEFPEHSHHKDNYDSRCKVCIKKRSDFVRQVKKYAPPKPDMCEVVGCSRKANACDHDPDISNPMNAFRGWICNEHNRSIGQLGDRVEHIESVLEYLQRAKKRGRTI